MLQNPIEANSLELFVIFIKITYLHFLMNLVFQLHVSEGTETILSAVLLHSNCSESFFFSPTGTQKQEPL